MSLASLCVTVAELWREAETVTANREVVRGWTKLREVNGRLVQATAQERAIRGQGGVDVTHKWFMVPIVGTTIESGDRLVIQLSETTSRGAGSQRIFRIHTSYDAHNVGRMLRLEVEELVDADSMDVE